MSNRKFVGSPLIVKIAVGLTFYNSWVLFEETVIDRRGLSRFLPFYEVGCFCLWDAAVIAVIVAFLFWRSRAAE